MRPTVATVSSAIIPTVTPTTRLWREDEDSAYSDADDLKWLTIEVESEVFLDY